MLATFINCIFKYFKLQSIVEDILKVKLKNITFIRQTAEI